MGKFQKSKKVETDRSADIEDKIEPQSPKLVENDKRGARDHFRGLGNTEKLRSEGSNFGLVGPSSAHAPKYEENEI